MASAIILCSGGLDSVVTAHYVKKKLRYHKLKILFFDYGQKSLRNERFYSKNCAKILGADFIEISLPELKKISNSLINKTGKISEIRRKDLKDTKEESKKWYVPCRNLLFLSYALALADSSFTKNKKINDIFVGFKCEGKDTYPDASEGFLRDINKMGKTACSRPFRILAPLIKRDKEDIINLGKKLKVDFKKTFSCYVGKKKHCGICLACALRKEGFYWSGLKDETKYLK